MARVILPSLTINPTGCTRGYGSRFTMVEKREYIALFPVKNRCLLTRKQEQKSDFFVHAIVDLETGEKSLHDDGFAVGGLHHVGLLCENTEKSLEFYCGLLGLTVCKDRPDAKLPYKGAWLWAGQEMVHLMELPNPDPITGRPEHGGRDRHACFVVQNVAALKKRLEDAGIPFTMSKSGRAAVFTRDPDGNALEFSEQQK